MHMQMGDLECQDAAPSPARWVVFVFASDVHTENPWGLGLRLIFTSQASQKIHNENPNDSLESSLLSPSSLIPLPPLHILWTSKKTLWRHVIKQFFIHALLFDDLAVCLNCSVHGMLGWASWKPILMRKGKQARAWAEFVNKNKGIWGKEQGQRGPSRISGLSGLSYPSEWPLVRQVKGTGVQQQCAACKMFCSHDSAASCSGLRHESSLSPHTVNNPASTWKGLFIVIFPSERFSHFNANKIPWGGEGRGR